MEEEIDLRAYAAVLFKRRYWIAGLALTSAIVTLVVSLLLPPTYEAAALLVVAKPRYEMQFDPRVQTVSDDLQPAYQAYPALALGDELLVALIQDLGTEPDAKERSVYVFRAMLTAETGSDPSIVVLTVKNGDPERAARIANRWAELFVQSTNQLYGESEQDLVFFESQLREAETALSKAEQDLIDFQAHNEASILAAQLGSKEAALAEYLRAARSLRLVIQNAESLKERLSKQDPARDASLSDELTALFIEIDALNSDALPIQLQLSSQQGFNSRTVGEQAAFLTSLTQMLETKLVALEADAKALEPDILTWQERLQQVQTKEDRLSLALQMAQETFVTLTRKGAETRISTQYKTGDVRLASRATVPEKPVSPRKLLNTVVGGTVGLLVGVLGAFAIEYWRQGQP